MRKFLKLFLIIVGLIEIGIIGIGLVFLQLSIVENQPKLINPHFSKSKILLLAVGDIMLDRGVAYEMEKHQNFKWPFLKISKYLQKGDILFGNLESPISDRGKKVGGVYSFRARPEVVEGLIWAGFDILSLANNHALDYQRIALEDTIQILRKNKIDYVGAGRNWEEAFQPKIIKIKGTKIGFLAFTNLGPKVWRATFKHSGIAQIDEGDFERIKSQIKKAKKEVDVLVISLHSGKEYSKTPTPFQKKFARVCIEAGADLIIGHHPHVIQPIEKYKQGWIAYSLGNFVFDQTFSKETREGILLEVEIKAGKISSVKPRKIKISDTFQPELIEIPTSEKSLSINSKKSSFSSFSYYVEPIYQDPKDQLVHHLFNIKFIPSPKCVAFRPQSKEIWVTSLLNKKRGLSIFDSLTGQHIKDINLDNGGGVEIIFTKDGSKAYVSQMETGRVFEIDADSKEILRIFDTKGTWTKVLALSEDENTLFASNWVSSDVSEIDLREGKVSLKISTVKTPRGIYLTRDGNTLYVAGFGRGELEKIDLKSGRGKVIFKSGGAMRHIVADEKKGVLYVSDMKKGIIWQVFLKTDQVKKFAKTDTNPNTIALSPDKKILFVSCRGKNFSPTNYYLPGPEWGSVLLFDTLTGEMLDAIVAGNQPTGLDISPDGSRLVFSDFLDGKLEIFEVPPYEILKKGNGGRSKTYKRELIKN